MNTTKSKLTYEQVRQIINERISLIDEKAEKSTAEMQHEATTSAEVDNRTRLWPQIKNLFLRKKGYTH